VERRSIGSGNATLSVDRNSDPADRITVETADSPAQPGEPGLYRFDASAAASSPRQERGQHPGESSVAVLERVNLQKHDDA
jgi:hypothetical protein